METKENSNIKKHKRLWTKLALIVSILVVLILILILFIVPAYISSASGRSMILGIVNKSVPGHADFSNLTVGWLRGIDVRDFSFKGTSGEINVQVKQFATEPHYLSILTGNFSFGKTTIDQPKIQINLQNQQKQQQTKVVSGKTSKVPTKSAGIVLATDIVVKDGNFKITDPKAGSVELSQINSNVNLRPLGQQSSFNLNMIMASAGGRSLSRLSADAQVTPAKSSTGWTMEGTSGQFSVEVNDLDIETLGPFFALAGLDVNAVGNLSANLKTKVTNGQVENINGTVNGKNLLFTSAAMKGDKISSRTLNADVQMTGGKQLINIEKFRLDSDFLNLQATGAIPAKFTSLNDMLTGSDYKLNGNFVLNLVTLVAQLPHTLSIRQGMQITSGRLSGDIAAQKGNLTCQVALENVAGVLDQKKLALSAPVTAKADITTDGKVINFKQINVLAPFATINANGDMKNIKYDGQADLAKLESELGQFVDFGGYQFAGNFTSNGTVKSDAGKITAGGSAAVTNLLLSTKDKGSVTEPKANVDFEVDYANDIVTVNTLQASTSFGQVGTKGAVVPLKKESKTPLKADVQVSKLDLSKVQPYAIMFGGLPKEMQMAGVADVQAAVSGQGTAFIVKSDSARINDLKFTYPGKKPFEEKYVTSTLEMEINPENKTINIKKLQLDSPSIKVNQVSFSQTNTNGRIKLTGQGELEYDWNALSNLIGSFTPAGLTMQGKRKDTINFSSEYPADKPDMMLSNLNAKAAVGFDKADYMGLAIGKTEVNINIVNGLLKIPPFAAPVNQGQLRFGCQADFKKQPPLFEITEPMQVLQNVNINDQTTKQLLTYLSPIFANAANISGIANLSCSKLAIPLNASAKDKAEIVGNVSINQLRLQSSDLIGQIISIIGSGSGQTIITVHPTEFVLKDGFLSYDDMQMDVGDNPVNFKGVIGLDKSLNMSVTLPYTTEGRTTRVGGQNQGPRITLPLIGTVDKPKIDTEKLLKNQLNQQLDNLLQKGLDQILK
jgi:hypothetical protein